MSYHPFYNPNLCRVCDDPLDRIHRAENRLMHPRCEQEWLALTPFPPCKFCEDFLSPHDVAARRTLHPHCELSCTADHLPDGRFLRKSLSQRNRAKQMKTVAYAANPSILTTSVLGQPCTSAAKMFLKYRMMKLRMKMTAIQFCIVLTVGSG